jgi:uncharacterized membrane protein YqjE
MFAGILCLLVGLGIFGLLIAILWSHYSRYDRGAFWWSIGLIFVATAFCSTAAYQFGVRITIQ